MHNWTEPLPKHTKVDVYECYAKVVLEEFYSNEVGILKIKDKPDLQSMDQNYGVEVTIAIDEDQLKADKLYTDIVYKRIRNQDKAKKEIEKCGCTLNKYSFTGKPGVDSFDLILKAFENKLKKLNYGEYRNFKQNCLFVFSDIYADEIMLTNAITNMKKRQLDSKKQFYKVYVLVPGYFYSLNLYVGSYDIIKINSTLQVQQSNKAREIVEMYENIK